MKVIDWLSQPWPWYVAGPVIGLMVPLLLIVGNKSRFLAPAQPVELLPADLFNWNNLLTIQGWILTAGGGFLVGFGTRYAGGCTSGHSIMGLSTLQWPSLVATICFMAGGFFVANLILPLILKL